MITPDKRKEIEELVQQVLTDEELGEWEFVWNGDPWCRRETKTIFLDPRMNLRDARQTALHEAVHAILGGGHEVQFWVRLSDLVVKYCSEGLNYRQTKMMTDYLYTDYFSREKIAHLHGN